MTKSKQGVFSWEDVLAQRYLNNHPRHQPQPHPRHNHEIQHIQHIQNNSLDQTSYYPFQPHSSLLAKLSPELRLLIWKYVLGGKCIHIVQWANRRMGYVVCPDSDGNGNKDKDKGRKGRMCDVCQTGLPSRRACAKRGTDTTSRGLLGVMLVCRQIYTEAGHILYTNNTFTIPSTWSLPYLLSSHTPPSPKSTLPPSSPWTTNLRSLTLHYAFPGHWLPSKDPVKQIYFTSGRAQWLHTCAAVCSLTHLEKFTLVLNGGWFAESVSRILVFLEPLRDVTICNRGTRRRGIGEEDGDGDSGGGGCWEVVLPKQPYYVNEVGRLDAEVRGRGLGCVFRV
ncbi:uncharacterized protein ASPGLDRAFT_47506 [Aspergillus glaucus CBS 516.65]|uniref:DUF7730 domain-containing protein n=1 Tax=Aspergillus glaucus CBS 516.65 TaxID=1160497 RepID=A0A1L9VIR1_ASPGL|nr:hypothetical protein ASPGLDRAFT_47506 [Aspergillus glaucus CBS 516.65]OJJ83819.1 hypothetical protein ASPGLDRAFT_47506 [Aspergillus glaucus CBS 516.65]